MPDACQPIPGDPAGRSTIEVTVQAPPIPPGQMGPPTHSTKKKLVLDTGGLTKIPKENVKDWGLKTGPGTTTNFGPQVELLGPEMIVEVWDQGHKNKRYVNCTKMMLHGLGETHFPGDSAGLLGGDQFDSFSADPAKLTDGTPYLCVRVPQAPQTPGGDH